MKPNKDSYKDEQLYRVAKYYSIDLEKELGLDLSELIYAKDKESIPRILYDKKSTKEVMKCAEKINSLISKIESTSENDLFISEKLINKLYSDKNIKRIVLDYEKELESLPKVKSLVPLGGELKSAFEFWDYLVYASETFQSRKVVHDALNRVRQKLN